METDTQKDLDTSKDIKDDTNSDNANGNDEIAKQLESMKRENSNLKKTISTLKDKQPEKAEISDEDKQHWIEIGEKRAKMSDKEKADDDMHRRESELQKREDEFKEKMKKLDYQNALNETRNKLSEKSLPTDLADFINDTDEEKRNGNIDKISSIINDYLDKQVENRLKGKKTPDVATNDVNNQTSMTKEQFYQLDYYEQVKLLKENPDVYNKFL